MVINVGQADTDPIVRKALAIGADEAIRVDADPADSYFVAKQIAHFAQAGGYDLILCGRETIDYNGAQVGTMVAELLGQPFVGGVNKLDLNGTEATMSREVDGGKEVVSANLPLVASVQEGITEPRIPTMRGIMSARTKPLQVEQVVVDEQFTHHKLYEPPRPKSDCKYVDPENVGELVRLLHEEAKVI